jgi:hypothetical protein
MIPSISCPSSGEPAALAMRGSARTSYFSALYVSFNSLRKSACRELLVGGSGYGAVRAMVAGCRRKMIDGPSRQWIRR